jgi:acetolactate synthase small subunit
MEFADATFTRTISDTIGYLNIFASIFARKNYSLEKLNKVPFSKGDLFSIMTGKINKGEVDVAVLELSVRLEISTNLLTNNWL